MVSETRPSHFHEGGLDEDRHIATAALALDDELAVGVADVARAARLRVIERQFMARGVSGDARLRDEYIALAGARRT